MANLAKTVTIEGPLARRNGDFRVLKTRNTLEVKPHDYLTEKEVNTLIRTGRLDLTIVAPKK